MTKPTHVRVLRLHSGDAGPHAEGSTYTTHLTHARELVAQGLAEIVAAPAQPPVSEPKPKGRTTKAS